MKRFALPALALLFAVLLVMPEETRAAVGIRLPLPDLVKSSPLVVRGKVTQSQSFQDPGTKRIMTKHTFLVAETWKGKATASVDVITLGGELEELGQWVPGEAVFTAEQEVVVFLVETKGGFAVNSMAQGLFKVQKGLNGLVLVRDLAGILFIGETDPGVRPVNEAKPEEIDLEQLKALCKSNGR